jgi:IS1 family transposase/transposase-like protein
MRKKTLTPTRPSLDTLACVNAECKDYARPGLNNLTVRKVYGQDKIRYLRCGTCQREFSERKGSALWNTKVSEARAESVAEHLAEGCSVSATQRLAKVDRSVVVRLNRCLGQHGQGLHDARVQQVEVEALEGDERHGYAGTRAGACWEAELIDPVSKFVLSHQQGARDKTLIEALLRDGAARLRNRHSLLLLTDGESSYASLFPEIFGVPYQPPRQGSRGRMPHVRYRIPRQLAHVQIVKHRQGARVVNVEVRFTHGSQKFAHHALQRLGYAKFNTSAVERRNGTARRMVAYQVRRSSAFAHRPETKKALGWWALTVYNWSRPHTALRHPLPVAQGKKSMATAPRRWHLA